MITTKFKFIYPDKDDLTFTGSVNLQPKDRIVNDDINYEIREIKNSINSSHVYEQTIYCSGSGLNE